MWIRLHSLGYTLGFLAGLTLGSLHMILRVEARE